MPQVLPSVLAEPGESSKERRKPQKRWIRWLPVLLAAAAAIYAGIIALNWPFTEQALIDALQERSLRTVTIGQFKRTYFPPGCTAEDIRFLHRKHKEKEPLITARRLVLVTSYLRILTLQERLSLVRVTDMHVLVPPTQPGVPNPVMPLTYSKSTAAIKVDTLIADGTILDFLPRTGQKPYRLMIDQLQLEGVGNNEPLAYRTLISNELPPGKIRSSGVFGNWNPRDPANTPLNGSYSFEEANLAAFGGISGTLNSAGSFKGRLGQVWVQGAAQVRHFKVSDTSHDRELSVDYKATVNGMNGDIQLDDVVAQFDQTTADFKGSIAGGSNGDAAGKTASMDMWTDHGRIEDILRLFISAKTSPMSGGFTFAGHVDIPPGPDPMLRRMKLRGDFGVTKGQFTNQQTEGDLTRLSESARSHNAQQHSDPNVVSDLKGHGSAVNAVATISDASFTIPGAKAVMSGTYGLIDYRLDLHGKLVTTGDPSDATTGFKSFMVKLLTPFFRRRHSMKVVPFKITGSYSNMRTALDLGR